VKKLFDPLPAFRFHVNLNVDAALSDDAVEDRLPIQNSPLGHDRPSEENLVR